MKIPPSTNNLIDIFVGVDIGKSFHCAAAINSRGNVLLKPLKVLASAEGFTAFEGHLRQLGDKTKLLIGLEASGHYWMSLWRFLLERDWQVEVFNPILSSQSARTHLRGRKTDADDALPALCATAISSPFNRAKKTPSNSSFYAGSGVLSATSSRMPSVGSPD
jgi:transposase